MKFDPGHKLTKHSMRTLLIQRNPKKISLCSFLAMFVGVFVVVYFVFFSHTYI